ncbi:hypothetical protein I7I50_02135 [Histoplasma capsulatum G186AR]|uniref:Uncharacterized protein n=1 Tax=Ajellomyces capsulatus TaxID=5037 RepID=A0A8H7YCX9_AJECA|nr:hypothetical protein I7I52_12349 [Histoplasma capsulatum]QSS71339.1 hypothetical protein I7I50_02135 [Histoplasma capsulatum G186AR]
MTLSCNVFYVSMLNRTTRTMPISQPAYYRRYICGHQNCKKNETDRAAAKCGMKRITGQWPRKLRIIWAKLHSPREQQGRELSSVM